MVIASLAGFVVAAQFVSLDLLEHPYYITLIGAGLLKLASQAPLGGPRATGRFPAWGVRPVGLPREAVRA
jgi:hypothetical protein